MESKRQCEALSPSDLAIDKPLKKESESVGHSDVIIRGNANNNNHYVRNKDFFEEDFESDFDEEVDEEFSDDDFEYGFADGGYVRKADKQKYEPEIKQLLSYLDLVNSDIMKYFGKNKDSEDAHDIYEDKWTSGKSGRELYYADLMKIAQGIDTEEPNSPPKSDRKFSDQKDRDKRQKKSSGRLDPSVGLGPLEGLFSFAQKDTDTATSSKKRSAASRVNGSKKIKKSRTDENNDKIKVPMSERKLPISFWKEPKSNSDCRADSKSTQSSDSTTSGVMTSHRTKRQSHISGNNNNNMDGISNANLTPDFADLLDCWGEVTPSQAHVQTHNVPANVPVSHNIKAV